MRKLIGTLGCLGLFTACAPRAVPPYHSYLYVFAGGYDHHSTSSDFFAVIDAEPSSPRYATIVATAPIGASGTQPHHMELTMPAGGRWLFANGFMSGRIFLFDLADPFHPRLASTIDSISSFRNPTAFGA